MRPLASLTAEDAGRLVGLVFDLDDTVLDRGALRLEAFSALFRLREAGLRLVACTGRPSGWGEVIARQWPLDAVVVENGAFAWVRELGDETVRVTSTDALDRGARAATRARLAALADELIAQHPEAALADDNAARVTDVAIDIGEHRRVSSEAVLAMRDVVRARGVMSHVSSVHLHLTLETCDKASGTVRLLVDHFGQDATRARFDFAYAGDSANDAQAFAAFRTTFGVANVKAHLGELSVPPAFVSEKAMGLGFAQIAETLARLRGRATGRSG